MGYHVYKEMWTPFAGEKLDTAMQPKNVGLSPSKKILFYCFIESPLKKTKNAFYFVLKALFVLKIFKFCVDILVM